MTTATTTRTNMDKTITKQLQVELQITRTALEGLDFPAAQQRIRVAEAALAAFPVGTTYHASSAAEREASGELKQARGALATLEQRAEALQQRMATIEHKLTASDRIDAGLAAVEEALSEQSAAALALNAAEANVARLAELLDAEVKADQVAAEAEGAAMLEAIKAGADAMTVAPPRASKAQALRIAQAAAEKELAAARGRAEVAAVAVSRRRLEVRGAEADVEELVYRVAEDAFIAAAGRLMAARARVKRPGLFFGPALHERAMRAMDAELAKCPA